MTIKERIGKFVLDWFERHGLTIVELGPIPRPFRTHGLARLWYDHGCPDKVGVEITVAMSSGNVAIFRLVNVEPATGVDWSWYDFSFVRYL